MIKTLSRKLKSIQKAYSFNSPVLVIFCQADVQSSSQLERQFQRNQE